MKNQKLDQLVTQLENFLECWKLLNNFINLARGKKFTAEDENQFLEVKAIVVQELELISAAIEFPSPSREEVHSFVAAAPSLRYLSESNEGALRALENQWHKLYVGFQAIVGQVKVKQRNIEGQNFLTSMFKKKP
ncbi:MAG TPA: hypothetical protein VN765_16580 [Candidatus Acidoferrum sp.]|nr:hypothetical protein [Candidatus Acidoferrum sp.]